MDTMSGMQADCGQLPDSSHDLSRLRYSQQSEGGRTLKQRRFKRTGCGGSPCNVSTDSLLASSDSKLFVWPQELAS